MSRIACALLLSATTAVQAAPVTFEFTGVLDSSEIAGWEAGTAISGQFTYDTDTAPASGPDSLGDGFSLATYAVAGPGSFVLNIGGEALSFSSLGILMLDSTGEAEGGEAFSLMAEGLTVGGEARDGAVQFTLATQGTNPAVLTTALPETLNLDDFDAPIISKVGSFQSDLSSNAKTANFTVTSLTNVTAVPEPATTWTMLMGLGLLGGAALRRRGR